MDSVDRAILNMIQTEFPIDRNPYEKIGLAVGITASEAWNRVNGLKENGIIRRIGGIFDSRRLGYISTLCAAKVPEEKVTVLAEISREITEITHNYLRDHAYNMWFTIIASSPDRLEEILTRVKAALGSEEVYSLPAMKVFKIGVHFDLRSDSTGQNINEEENNSDSKKENTKAVKGDTQSIYRKNSLPIFVVTEKDKKLIRILQNDLPGSQSPFADIAAELNTDEEQVIAHINSLIAKQMMRRLGAILYHDKAGFTSNAMGVWIVPQELTDEVGQKMAGFKEVSHCYERPPLPDWPYNLFTMIHGQTDEECKTIMLRISDATGIKKYAMLFSQSELKKSSMRYFIE